LVSGVWKAIVDSEWRSLQDVPENFEIFTFQKRILKFFSFP